MITLLTVGSVGTQVYYYSNFCCLKVKISDSEGDVKNGQVALKTNFVVCKKKEVNHRS